MGGLRQRLCSILKSLNAGTSSLPPTAVPERLPQAHCARIQYCTSLLASWPTVSSVKESLGGFPRTVTLAMQLSSTGNQTGEK